MSAAQHTPGPWSEPCNYSATRFEVQGSADGRARKIAVIDRAADAWLIAAAPELLEALQRVVSSNILTLLDNGYTQAEAIALIAKATGAAA